MSNEQGKGSPKVLCVYGSPRAGGNTDVMMERFAAGVEKAGGTVRKVVLRELNISPCKELYRCRRFGECAINDDMTPLYAELLDADAVALASPVMFYAVSAMTKAFIDRCQALWAVKYLLKKPMRPEGVRGPKGILLSAGGSAGQKLFDGIRMTFKYFLDAIDGEFAGEYLIRNVDVRGDAGQHPEALDEIEALGAALVAELSAGRGAKE